MAYTNMKIQLKECNTRLNMMKLSYFNKILLNNYSKSNNYFNNIYLHKQITSL